MALDFNRPNSSELDLSNELFYTIAGQEAAKMLEVKVRGRKKICWISWP